MPLVKCMKDGKPGWKWGKENKSCFTGPNGKKDALRQGRAIEINKRKSEGANIDLIQAIATELEFKQAESEVK